MIICRFHKNTTLSTGCCEVPRGGGNRHRIQSQISLWRQQIFLLPNDTKYVHLASELMQIAQHVGNAWEGSRSGDGVETHRQHDSIDNINRIANAARRSVYRLCGCVYLIRMLNIF
jgi:hypothetical protein